MTSKPSAGELAIEDGKLYYNGRGDLLGPMRDMDDGIFLDQFGRLYRLSGQQWDHVPGSTGNIVATIEQWANR
jgi:hypothetical protein